MEYLNAFLCGGILCVIGQVLIDRTSLTPAKILVAYVTAGVILSGAGVYQYLVDWGGAGATVPLTGFGHLLAKGVKKAVEQDGLIGALTGGSTAAAEKRVNIFHIDLLCQPSFRACIKCRKEPAEGVKGGSRVRTVGTGLFFYLYAPVLGPYGTAFRSFRGVFFEINITNGI